MVACEEGLHALLDEITDCAHFLERPARWIWNLPPLDRRANERAGIAAAHRDRDIGALLHLLGELLRPTIPDLDCGLSHHLDDLRRYLLRGFGPGGLGP